VAEGHHGRPRRPGGRIVSAVEHESDYGRKRPDWDEVLDRIESSEEGLDLGTDKTDPVIQEILRRSRKIYKELSDA
jgi:hypothetical protein